MKKDKAGQVLFVAFLVLGVFSVIVNSWYMASVCLAMCPVVAALMWWKAKLDKERDELVDRWRKMWNE